MTGRFEWLSICGIVALAVCVSSVDGVRAQDATPLSSIDWLSDSLAEEAALRPMRRALPFAAEGASVEPVTVTLLDTPATDGAGLRGAQSLGLPADLWGPATTDDIARRLASFPADPLPATRDAMKRLLVSRLDPPSGGGTPGALLIARIDLLLRFGALETAEALLQEVGTERPELFRRAFDIALLQGKEDAGCMRLRTTPGIAPSLSVRIFCLARSGDWPAAALTLETASALGQLSSSQSALLSRFLEPELAEGVPPLARLPAPTPLEWRMLEAIGERQPTSGLPRAFAHADLRETAGWKTRIEATERLVRAGALAAGRLCEVYGERQAAASGGVWERVAAVQALDRALLTQSPEALAEALPSAWDQMQDAGLAVAFAELYAPRLAPVALADDLALIAYHMALLTPDYEGAAGNAPLGASRFLSAVARGQSPLLEGTPEGRITSAISRGFASDPPGAPDTLLQLSANGRLGEALIEALRILGRGTDSDEGDLAAALAFLRAAGLEDTARQGALQLALLGDGT